MSIIFAILKLIVVIGVVATVHELGHYIFAKIFKMKVNEFSIGFGPVIYSKQGDENKTKFSIRCIPLGRLLRYRWRRRRNYIRRIIWQ